MKITVRAYAKVNLSLAIRGVKDGFHDLDSVVASVDLFDEVTAEKTGDGTLRFECFFPDGQTVPDEKNNAFKAMKLFCGSFGVSGVKVSVKKGIPVGGGLGGSSASAAGTLNALAKLFSVKADLRRLANALGSDTAFQLFGGVALMSGLGGDLEFIDGVRPLDILLAFPDGGVDTSAAYAKYDELKTDVEIDNRRLVSRLVAGRKDVGEDCKNALMPAAICLNGDVARVYGEVSGTSPLAVSMSGSGSTVFAIYGNSREASSARDFLVARGVRCAVTKTL